ncbi:hypothetical protein JTB14_007470 [Gonioctena quinquepunctata]|nr:hypothetical protein JTB14_007470 [Gonioctena quinquepunctata]
MWTTAQSLQTYAGDTQVYHWGNPASPNCPMEKINVNLQNIDNFPFKYELLLNPTETEVSVFGPLKLSWKYQHQIHVEMNNAELCRMNGTWWENLSTLRKHVSNCMQGAYAYLKMLIPHRSNLTSIMKAKLNNHAQM